MGSLTLSLRIRRSQVRVLPSAPQKCYDLQEKREAEIKGRSPVEDPGPIPWFYLPNPWDISSMATQWKEEA
jgi:hypothetical protein